CRRLRRSVRSTTAARRADEPRLRRRLPPVHRAGCRRERRTGRSWKLEGKRQKAKAKGKSKRQKEVSGYGLQAPGLGSRPAFMKRACPYQAPERTEQFSR